MICMTFSSNSAFVLPAGRGTLEHKVTRERGHDYLDSQMRDRFLVLASLAETAAFVR